MQAKELQFRDSARARMQAGVNLLADAVRITLGPKGRFVVVERAYGSPVIANSGVLRRECFHGSAYRSFTFGQDINEAEVKAKHDNGVLTLTLPKKPGRTTKQIPTN